MVDLKRLSEQELYALGKQIGELSQERPDIGHRIILGVRDGLHGWGIIQNLCDVLWALWRHGEFKAQSKNLKIPFASLSRATSGSGENK